MFTFVSGNKTQADETARILSNLATLVELQQHRTGAVSLKALAKDPLFVMPAKGDFRMKINSFKDGGEEKRPCIYDGNSSYVDWTKTIQYGTLVVMGLVHEE